MKPRIPGGASLMTAFVTLLLAFVAFTPSAVQAAGGSKSGGGGGGGGGGGSTVLESRVTGYITAIDYVNQTLTVGASYYGTGKLLVTSATKISLNNVNGTLSQIKLGDWAEARYIWTTKEATKLSITRP
ncbi:MAG: hypothetical protein JNL10_15075 [Verrucomicrobiales bacterium]|nr:hypothetical protein [Verrucomicrobiales bacterium]